MTDGASSAPPTGMSHDTPPMGEGDAPGLQQGDGGKLGLGRSLTDPIVGLGLVIVGVLVMGIAGAATLHYLFNAGTAIAILGAMMFVVAVALSSLREALAARREKKKTEEAARRVVARDADRAPSSS